MPSLITPSAIRLQRQSRLLRAACAALGFDPGARRPMPPLADLGTRALGGYGGRIKTRFATRPKDTWRRTAIPYGVWRADDGREILFNRHYHLIWQRRPGEPVERAESQEQIAIVSRTHFYNDGHTHGQRVERGAAVLVEWGIID